MGDTSTLDLTMTLAEPANPQPCPLPDGSLCLPHLSHPGDLAPNLPSSPTYPLQLWRGKTLPVSPAAPQTGPTEAVHTATPALPVSLQLTVWPRMVRYWSHSACRVLWVSSASRSLEARAWGQSIGQGHAQVHPSKLRL